MNSKPSTVDSLFRHRSPGMLALRKQLREVSSDVLPLSWSSDGRTFSFQAAISFPLPAGGYVIVQTGDSRRYLGQIFAKETVTREGPEWRVDLSKANLHGGGARVPEANIRFDVRFVTGSGTLLARVDGNSFLPVDYQDVFSDADIHQAPQRTVSRYLKQTHANLSTLEIGTTFTGDIEAPARLLAKGFSRHTFLCGQSGSGKTYSLGVILERLLLETDLRLIILDPNTDFTHLGELKKKNVKGAAAYRRAAAGIRVFRPNHADSLNRLAIRFSDLSAPEQGTVLQLDPLRDREEFHAFRRLVAGLAGKRYSLGEVRTAAEGELSPEARQIALRIGNLGVADWSLWSDGSNNSVVDLLPRSDWRAAVIDLSGLGSAEEQAVASIAVLDNLWQRREDRSPVLIVIDEAHNLCPSKPWIRLQQTCAEHIVRIAGEGRKYGLHLLLSSQEPGKINPNALSQCDNLVLLRMNSLGDLNELQDMFSFVPSSMFEQASFFSQGEALIAGQIVHQPMMARFKGRLAREGGGDVPTTWATPR